MGLINKKRIRYKVFVEAQSIEVVKEVFGMCNLPNSLVSLLRR